MLKRNMQTFMSNEKLTLIVGQLAEELFVVIAVEAIGVRRLIILAVVHQMFTTHDDMGEEDHLFFS